MAYEKPDVESKIDVKGIMGLKSGPGGNYTLADAYAIQERGAALVRRIDGDYLNVVGLPLAALLDVPRFAALFPPQDPSIHS